MPRTKHSTRSPSTSSSERTRARSPPSSDYEYVGRLVTRERPVHHQSKSKSIQKNWSYHAHEQKYHPSSASRQSDAYEEVQRASDNDDPDGLSRPLGVIRINDRHYREIYRLPTPPPKVKRVYHRLRSPEPKIIERVYVRRPAPQIIENVIEVPPEKVKIIHREKLLENTKPITRSRLVRLKAKQDEEPAPTTTHTIDQNQTLTTLPAAATANTALVYPPNPNLRTVGYIQSDIPPHVMFASQQQQQPTAQMPTQTSLFPAPMPVSYPTQQPLTIPGANIYGYQQY